jgi:hypothetical protein
MENAGNEFFEHPLSDSVSYSRNVGVEKRIGLSQTPREARSNRATSEASRSASSNASISASLLVQAVSSTIISLDFIENRRLCGSQPQAEKSRADDKT